MNKKQEAGCEISLIQLSKRIHNLKPIYRVTKRFPLEGVQQTELFDDLSEAKEQLNKWKKEHLK